MSFADKRTRKARLRILNEQRATRIRKLIDKGLIQSAKDIPEHAIPIDPDRSTLVTLTVPPAFYKDIEFNCIACGTSSIWLAETQQYYFEVLRASPHNRVVRCPDCQATWKHSNRPTGS